MLLAAVHIDGLLVFGVDVEDLAERRYGQVEALLVDGFVSLGRAAGRFALFGILERREGARTGEVVFDGAEQTLTTAEAFFHLFGLAEAGGGRDVLRRLAGVLDRERSVHHAEEAGADALGGAADADETRQRQVFRGQQRRGHGAKGRVLHDRIRLPAGVHQHGAAFMAAFVGHQGADQRQVLELLGDFRQDFGDLDAGGRGLDRLEFAAGLLAGLEVPQVHMAGAAAHPHDDEAFVFFLELRLGRFEAGEEVQARHRQGGSPRHVREEVPPTHPTRHGFPLVREGGLMAQKMSRSHGRLTQFGRNDP